jgi:hypothetical protein
MRIRVTNVLGVASADAPVNGLLLVGGLNGAGKSSLLHSAAAAALKLWTLRGARLRADAPRIVRRGAEAGSAMLDWGTGAVRVSWPTGEIDTNGDGGARSLGSAYAIGAVRWMEMEPKARQADLSARLNLAPTEADIEAWLTERHGDTLKADAIATLAAAIAKKLDLSGWDAVHRTAVEHGTKLKGRWEQATGQAWGEKKADGWAPAGLLRGETYSVEDAERDLDAAKAVLQQALAAGAVTQAEIDAADAAGKPALELRIAADKLKSEAAEVGAALERLMEQRQQLRAIAPRDAAERPPEIPCPHCRKPVAVALDPMKPPRLFKPTAVAEPPPEAVAAREGVEEAIASTQAAAKALAERLADANHAAMTAERAMAKALKLRDAPKRNVEAVSKAQAEVARLEARLAAVKQLHQATGIFHEWRQQQPIIKALAPDGVRAAVLATKLTEFNARLASLCEIGRWAKVVVDADAEPRYGDLPYQLLSESERWRVDLTLQVAFAIEEGAALMLVDRLDVLAAPSRPGAIMLLKHTGIPTIIGMTAAKPEPPFLPDLAAAKVGRSAWIEDGTLRLL